MQGLKALKNRVNPAYTIKTLSASRTELKIYRLIG